MKALKSSALGLLSFVLVSMGFIPAAQAAGTSGQEVAGSNVVAVYHHFGGKMTEQLNVGDNSVVKFVGGKADSVWQGEVCKSRYVYGNGGFLSQVVDMISGAISFYLGNGKKALDVTGDADLTKVQECLNILEQSSTGSQAASAAYDTVKSKILNENIKGISSITQYDNNFMTVGVQNFDVAAKGTNFCGSTLTADKVIANTYVQYQNGRAVAEYSAYTCVDKDGNQVTNEEITAQLAKITDPTARNEYLNGIKWTASTANNDLGVKTATYKYNGNALVEIDRLNADGKVLQKQIFENGQIARIVDGTSGKTMQEYVRSGTVLVKVVDYTDSQTGDVTSSPVTTTYFDKYGRESFSKDRDGNIIGWTEYNDTNQPTTQTITDSSTVAKLKELIASGEMKNAKVVGDTVVVTTLPGQIKAKYSKNAPDSTVYNCTVMNQMNMAAVTYQTSTGPLNFSGTDPIAQCKLTVGADGSIEGLIDLETMYDPTGSKSKEQLKAEYKSMGVLVEENGKSYVKVQILAIDKAALDKARSTTHYSKTVDASQYANKDLQKQIMNDAALGKTDQFRWTYTSKSSSGKLIILVEERIATF